MGSLFKQSSILKFSNKTCLVNILFFRKTFSNFSRLVFNTLFSCSWGHPSRTYAIFCKKNDPPHPLIRTCTFCNTPPPPTTTTPHCLFLCKIEFFVQNFIRFRDAAYSKKLHTFQFFSLHISHLQQNNVL